MILEACSSTNDELKKRISEATPQGAWVSAFRQTSGRGRQGRSWESPIGGLYFSVLLKNLNSEQITWTPLGVAVEIAKVIERLGERVLIKWPNDLIYENAKAGGILCESVSKGAVVVGVGLNCEKKPDLQRKVSSLPFSAGDLRMPLVQAISQFRLERERIREELLARSYYQLGEPLRSGVFSGIGPLGELEVRGSSGVQRFYEPLDDSDSIR